MMLRWKYQIVGNTINSKMENKRNCTLFSRRSVITYRASAQKITRKDKL